MTTAAATPDTPVLGEIRVVITDAGLQCESELPIPEVVFWLRCAEKIVLDNFLNAER